MTGLVVAFAESSKSKTHEFGTSRSGTSASAGKGSSKHRHSAALTYATRTAYLSAVIVGLRRGCLARFESRNQKCR